MKTRIPKYSNLSLLPSYDTQASAVSRWVVDLANKNQSKFFHFETRVRLEYPEAWGAAETNEKLIWKDGRAIEGKYSDFRSDFLRAGFQPAHSARWTPHELLHSLLGFCWADKGSVFYNSLCARISEALPVAQFYFFEEMGRTKCERHKFSHSIYQTECLDCRDASLSSSGEFSKQDFSYKMGIEFLTRELDAVKLSLKTGRVYENVFAGLNLTTDAMYYAKNQQARMYDPLSLKIRDRLFFPNDLAFESIEALIENFESLIEGFSNQDTQSIGISSVSEEMSIKHDLSQRLLQMMTLLDQGSVESAVESLIFDNLLSGSENAIEDTISEYQQMCEKFELVPAEEMFAVGYDLPLGMGHSAGQLKQGLESQVPEWMAKNSSEKLEVLIKDFSYAMPITRLSIAERFSSFLEEQDPEVHKSFCNDQFRAKSLRPANRDVFYLEPESLDKLHWNPEVLFLDSSKEVFEDWDIELDLLDVYEKLLVLRSIPEESPRVFLLESGEYDQVTQMIEGNFKPSLSHVVYDLVQNEFLTKTHWELFDE